MALLSYAINIHEENYYQIEMRPHNVQDDPKFTQNYAAKNELRCFYDEVAFVFDRDWPI